MNEMDEAFGTGMVMGMVMGILLLFCIIGIAVIGRVLIP